MIWVLLIVGYVIVGLGVSRFIYAHQYEKVFTEKSYVYGPDDAHELTINDDQTFAPAMFAFPFWPVFLVWFLLIKPIGAIVWPWAVKWYTAPAHKRVAS